MNLRKSVLLIVSFLTTILSFSQDSKQSSFQLYGFVRSDFYSDSRKSYNSVQDLFSFYPMYKNINEYGDDLNSVRTTGLASVISRLGFSFDSPGLFGAKNKSAIEVDFGGAPNYWILRIRQAYTQLSWKNSELLIGQTWHPLFSKSIMPNILSLNTGSPFQPFNRSPQVLYNYNIGNLKLSSALIYQMMYSSVGPEGTSFLYQRNANIPEIFIGTEFRKNGFLFGLGADYKTILPERYITDNNGVTVINKKKLGTPTGMAYGSFTKNIFTFKGKVMYGQNLAEHAMIGGYAITPDHEYIPYNTFSTFFNLCYGKTHMISLLGGYTANLGPTENLPDNSRFYGFGVDKANTASEKIVGNIYRFSPSYSYNLKNWKIGVELEYTNASWGNRSEIDGSIIYQERADNYRAYAILMYMF